MKKYITSVASFVEEISKGSFNSKYVYRGQSQASWGIIASVFRNGYDENKEEYIYSHIRKYNFPELQKRDYYLDDLIDMQHYGIPTRLIDWSYNPLISLYFAVAYDTNVDGKLFRREVEENEILSFDSEKYKYLSKLLFTDVKCVSLSFDEYDKEINEIIRDLFDHDKNIYFIDTIISNSRIRAQQGCFSLYLDKKKKFYDYINKATNIEREIKTQLNNKIKSINRKTYFDLVKLLIDNYNPTTDKNEYLEKNYINLKKLQNKIDITKVMKEKFIDSRLKVSDENYREIVQISSNIIDSFKTNHFEIQTNYEVKDNKLTEYVIEANNKNDIKKELEKIGVNSLMIYPDITGMVEHLANNFKQ